MKLIRTDGKAGRSLLERMTANRSGGFERALPVARRIVEGVKRGGDPALLRFRRRLDGIPLQTPLQITVEEMEAAWKAASPELKAALRTAARNIRAFAEKQRPRNFDLHPAPGVTTGQRIVPLDAVGCYVPGGRYPLPSTLLMTAIPAQVAGVPRIVAVSPGPAPQTLAAAAMLGITEFYRIGGAQAVAALAYGTASLPRVNKIVGPGNAFVTAAKKLVSFDCGIDMLAGPTEIAVVSDHGNAAAIAADLVAQAEHDPDALAVLFTSRIDLARAVIAEVKQRMRGNTIASQALAANGAVVVTRSPQESQQLANQLAPEHLTIDREEDLAWVRNAGSVFIGRYAAQPLGDYVSGPNHTLPTSGLARLRGGLSVLDFVKVMTIQHYSAEGVKKLGPAAITLAEAEGLIGHATAIRQRGAK